MIDLKKFVTFRLPTWKNEAYWKWISSQRRDGWEWHHLLKRQYGNLLVVLIPSEQHKRIHQKGYNDGEFEDLFLIAINNLISYIEHLQKGE